MTRRIPGRIVSAAAFVMATAASAALGSAALASDAIAMSCPPVIRGAPEAVAVDAAGNRYVTGGFTGTVDFNPVAGIDMKSSVGGEDVFVTRFNADGSYGWTQTFGGSGAYDRGADIAVLGTTVYVTGTFQSANAGFGGPGAVAAWGGQDAFVLALNAATGAPMSAFGNGGVQKFGGSNSSDNGHGIAASGTTVYVTGSFFNNNAGVGGPGVIASSGQDDAYVLALDSVTGAAVAGFGTGGVQKFGGSGTDEGFDVAVSGTTVYVTGMFMSADAGVGGLGSAASSGAMDAFVLALNGATGAAVTGFGIGGVQKFGGAGSGSSEVGWAVAVSGTTVYVTGQFNGLAAGVGGPGSVATSGDNDAFILALDGATGAAKSGFGNGGVQKFGGSSPEGGFGIATSGTTVYVTGFFGSANAGVGGPGSVAASGSGDAFVLALNGTTGAGVAGFGVAGVQKFGGSSYGDAGRGIAVSGTTVHVTGTLDSTNAGVGGTGSASKVGGFKGFLLRLDGATGAGLPPVITSPLTATGVAGQAFSYAITATDFPTGFNATGLPAPLSVNTSTGVVSGTLPPAGAYSIGLGATNGTGTGTATLLLTTTFADAIATSHPPVIRGVARAVAVDPAGNRYVTGHFTGTVDFNPVAGVDVKTSAGLDDAFVTRFDADGSYRWTQTFGGSDYDNGFAVAVSGGTVFVTGRTWSVDAGVGGTGTASSAGLEDAFVLALDSATGAAVSSFGNAGVQTFGGSGYDQGLGVACLGTTVYVTGYFGSNDAGVGGTGAFGTSGYYDAFVLALDAVTGVPMAGFGAAGVQKFGGSGFDMGHGIAVLGGSPVGPIVYVTGELSSADAGVGGIGSVGGAGGGDAFVLSLSGTTGAAMGGFGGAGVQTFGGSNFDEGNGIVVSGGIVSAPTVYVTGNFSGSDAHVGVGDVMGGPGTFAASGGSDAFVLALNGATGAAASGFGVAGVQTFGGTATDTGDGIAVARNGQTVYATGRFDSVDAGVGATGSVAPTGNSDAYVLALNAASGAAAGGFGVGGVAKFGGWSPDFGFGVAVTDATVCATGTFFSSNAGLGGPGDFSTSGGFFGFLLDLDAKTGGGMPPVITSPLVATGVAGQSFSYAIAATGVPTGFSATNLPAGLAVDASTGVVSGTSPAAGTYDVTIGAANGFGTGTRVLVLTTTAPLAVVSRFTMTLRRSSKSPSDGIEIAGTLMLADGTDVARKPVSIDVNGYSVKGLVSGGAEFKIAKPKHGEANFVCKLSRLNLFECWPTGRVTGDVVDPTDPTMSVVVGIVFDGAPYSFRLTARFGVKKNVGVADFGTRLK